MDNIGKGYETWWRDHREWLESFGYKLRRNLQVVPDVLSQDRKKGHSQFVSPSAVDVYVSLKVRIIEPKYVNGCDTHHRRKASYAEEGCAKRARNLGILQVLACKYNERSTKPLRTYI